MAVATLAPPAVDVQDLVDMFTGDDLTPGCASVRLVEEICRRTQPLNASMVRIRIYGDWPTDTVPKQALCAVAVGYSDWVRAGRPS